MACTRGIRYILIKQDTQTIFYFNFRLCYPINKIGMSAANKGLILLVCLSFYLNIFL